jgi:hypothetical protein
MGLTLRTPKWALYSPRLLLAHILVKNFGFYVLPNILPRAPLGRAAVGETSDSRPLRLCACLLLACLGCCGSCFHGPP